MTPLCNVFWWTICVSATQTFLSSKFDESFFTLQRQSFTGVLQNSSYETLRKHLCLNTFFNNVADCRIAASLKRVSCTGFLLWILVSFSKLFFSKHLLVGTFNWKVILGSVHWLCRRGGRRVLQIFQKIFCCPWDQTATYFVAQ